MSGDARHSGHWEFFTLARTEAATAIGPVDTLVVAGADRLAEQTPEAELLAAAAHLAERTPRVASVCTGAFVLAELGLLDGRSATTHWRHANTLARRHPRVRVEPDALHVRDGRYVTSAGISAGIDLALALVEADHGADTAREAARELVVFMQRPGGQSQFSTALETPPPRSDLLASLTASVLADPAADHSPPAMAAAAALSTRHLTRLFRTELHTTPARWVERVRLDRAQQLLLDGHSVTSAAHHSGLGSDETLRRAFARHLGTTPTEYRSRFTTTRPPAGPPPGRLGMPDRPGGPKLELCGPARTRGRRPSRSEAPMSADARRVAVVGDCPLLRNGVAHVVEDADGFAPALTTRSADEAVDALGPGDLALVDLQVPAACLSDMVGRLTARGVSVLVFSSGLDNHAVPAMRAGAHGCVSRQADERELLAALRLVADGCSYISADLAVRPDTEPSCRVTDRERQILELIAHGETDHDIAGRGTSSPS
ncbi:helix-turn-helix domain-containing protein [Streptomyces sp. P17]|uniref:helix-turn-helix domain-containing protein n=1 Tax=Streptomyces sp. P17 TaxID=3074716 RepID=UPI0028F41268|nr:helix-turn-helix domain-containing protein [Streptomyces sp. P17]MDT9695675.1 helix-turn-helix domain-containing protein [Streptomyces sp. P17]